MRRIRYGQGCGGGRRVRRDLRQPLLVVLEEQPPGPGVPLDHLEHGLPLVGHQRMGREGPRHQPDRLLDLAHAPLPQPALVQRVAAQQVFPQGARRPDAELRAALGVDAVADRNDGVEVVEPELTLDLPSALGSNYRGILGSCRLVQLPFEIDVLEVQADVVDGSTKQIGHLLLGQPDRLPLQPHIDPHLTIGSLVDEDLSAGNAVRAGRRSSHQAVLPMNRSASFTRRSPLIRLGSRASRRAARVRDSRAHSTMRS